LSSLLPLLRCCCWCRHGCCRMKLPEAVGSIQFYKPDHFLCLAGNTVSKICSGSGMAPFNSTKQRTIAVAVWCSHTTKSSQLAPLTKRSACTHLTVTRLNCLTY
jgi:hypothetical protein